MKSRKIFLWGWVFVLAFSIASMSCKSRSKSASFDSAPAILSDIDTQKIGQETGVTFKILKTEELGYSVIQKYFWVLLKEKAPSPKLEELASRLIKDTIARKPNTFHGFTIHFIDESRFSGSIENSKCFAKANYLPRGDWEMLGRVPIDDYKEYKLVCSILIQ